MFGAQREVGVETAEQYAQYYRVPFAEVSAKTGTRDDLCGLLTELINDVGTDEINAQLRAIVTKTTTVSEVLDAVRDGDVAEFDTVMKNIRFTFRMNVDTASLCANVSDLKTMCDTLGKMDALLDTYILRVQRLTEKKGAFRRMMSNNRLRKNIEKVSYELDTQRVIVENVLRRHGVEKQLLQSTGNFVRPS